MPKIGHKRLVAFVQWLQEHEYEDLCSITQLTRSELVVLAKRFLKEVSDENRRRGR